MDHYSFNSQSEYEELGTGDWSNQNLWEWADWEVMRLSNTFNFFPIPPIPMISDDSFLSFCFLQYAICMYLIFHSILIILC